MVSPESNLFVAPQPDVAYQPALDYQLLRDQMLGDEGGIKSSAVVVIAAVGAVIAGAAYLKGWNPFETPKLPEPKVDATVVFQSELNHVVLPGSIRLLTASGTSRFAASVNISEGPIGGSVVGCANRQSNTNIFYEPLKNPGNNKTHLEPSNTDKTYKLEAVTDKDGNEHLKIYVDPSAFSAENVSPRTASKSDCETYTTGAVQWLPNVFPAGLAAGFQDSLNQAADDVAADTCPATVIEKGLLPIAVRKWVQAEVQGVVPLVIDEVLKAYPNDPKVAATVGERLIALTKSDPEVVFVNDPNSPSADLTKDLGVSAVPISHDPEYSDTQLTSMAGINPSAISDGELHIERPTHFCEADGAATDIKDILQTAKEERDAYNAKYHGATSGEN